MILWSQPEPLALYHDMTRFINTRDNTKPQLNSKSTP